MIESAEIVEMLAEFDADTRWTGAKPSAWPPMDGAGPPDHLILVEMTTVDQTDRPTSTVSAVVLSGSAAKATKAITQVCDAGVRVSVTPSSILPADMARRLNLHPDVVRLIEGC